MLIKIVLALLVVVAAAEAALAKGNLSSHRGFGRHGGRVGEERGVTGFFLDPANGPDGPGAIWIRRGRPLVR